MTATIRDVAKEAGVSFPLVSKYLNHHPQARMTPETEQRIREAIRKLNYCPSATARSLKTGRTGTLGLLIGNLTNAFYAHFADAALRCATEAGYQMLVSLYDNEKSKSAAYRNLLSRRVDAIFSPDGIILDISEEVIRPGRSNTIGALKKALGYLKECGCVRIGGVFFADPVWRQPFEQAAAAQNLSLTSIQADFDESVRTSQLRRLCRQTPDAIFSNGWQTTVMLIEMLEKEFPGYHPKLLLRANCCGEFLNHPSIFGALYSSEKALIRNMVSQIVRRLENPKTDLKLAEAEMEFLPRKELRKRGLAEGGFRLT